MRTKSTAGVAISSLALLYGPIALARSSQQPPWDWPGSWHMWHGGWMFGWLCLLFMLFIFVGAAVLVLRRSSAHPHWGPPWMASERAPQAGRDPTYSALQILNERFARGEIDKQEFEEKKAAILASRPG